MRKAILLHGIIGLALNTMVADAKANNRTPPPCYKKGDLVPTYAKPTTNNQRKRRKKIRQTPQLLNSKKYK